MSGTVGYQFKGRDVACGRCSSTMHPCIGRRVIDGRPRQIVWWACSYDPGHITASVPLPDDALVYARDARDRTPPCPTS